MIKYMLWRHYSCLQNEKKNSDNALVEKHF